MAKTDAPPTIPTDAVISIIGAGMTIEGDADTVGSLRIEGTIRGDVRAEKSVVIGKDGLLEGSLYTQDAVIAGRVIGAVYAESHLELQATGQISGEIQARQMHVEDGAAFQGLVKVRPDVDHSTGSEKVLWGTLSLCRAASRGIQQPEGEGGDHEGRSWSNDTQASPLVALHIDRRPPPSFVREHEEFEVETDRAGEWPVPFSSDTVRRVVVE